MTNTSAIASAITVFSLTFYLMWRFDRRLRRPLTASELRTIHLRDSKLLAEFQATYGPDKLITRISLGDFRARRDERLAAEQQKADLQKL